MLRRVALSFLDFQRFSLVRGYSTRHETRHGLTPCAILRTLPETEGIMSFFLIIVGALEMIGGVMTFLTAKSAIHEILGAIMFGMGVLAIGIGGVIVKADRQLDIFDRLGKPKA